MWPAKKPVQSGFGNPFGIWKDHGNLDKKESVKKKTTKLASPLQNEQPIKSGSNVQKENKNKNNIDYKKKNTFYHDDFNNR